MIYAVDIASSIVGVGPERPLLRTRQSAKLNHLQSFGQHGRAYVTGEAGAGWTAPPTTNA
jgi:hypothetical protein